MKKNYVMQEQWDYLIVLDACRYDYFEKLYSEYLTGKLEKRISVGSSTCDWRDKSFGGHYPDVLYVSANPFINSRVATKGFAASDHFCKVYDLWLTDWDRTKGTVLPENVTNSAVRIVKSNPDKRVIIHYVQPHEPYISYHIRPDVLNRDTPVRSMLLKTMDVGGRRSLRGGVYELIRGVLYRLGVKKASAFWKVVELLGMPPANHMDGLRRRLGKEGLREAYEDNLRLVLSQLPRLIEHLHGRVVITADHGELLGKDNWYGHPRQCYKAALVEVPWLLIDRGERTVELSTEPVTGEVPDSSELTEADRKNVEKRLKALGYQ